MNRILIRESPVCTLRANTYDQGSPRREVLVRQNEVKAPQRSVTVTSMIVAPAPQGVSPSNADSPNRTVRPLIDSACRVWPARGELRHRTPQDGRLIDDLVPTRRYTSRCRCVPRTISAANLGELPTIDTVGRASVVASWRELLRVRIMKSGRVHGLVDPEAGFGRFGVLGALCTTPACMRVTTRPDQRFLVLAEAGTRSSEVRNADGQSAN